MSRRRGRPWTELRREMGNSPARAFGTLYRRFQESVNQRYAARGWKGVSLSHVQFLAETTEDGSRLSDVASALKTSKQYVGKLAKELASRHLVTLVADPRDRRAVLAVPTERARALFQDACEIRAELEAQFLGQLSASRAAAFVEALKELVASSSA